MLIVKCLIFFHFFVVDQSGLVNNWLGNNISLYRFCQNCIYLHRLKEAGLMMISIEWSELAQMTNW